MFATACTRDVYKPVLGNYHYQSYGGNTSVIAHFGESSRAAVPCKVVRYRTGRRFIVVKSENVESCMWPEAPEVHLAAPFSYWVIDAYAEEEYGPYLLPRYRAVAESLGVEGEVIASLN